MTADNVTPLTGKSGKARAAAMAPTSVEDLNDWPEVVPFEATDPPAPFPTSVLPRVMERFIAGTAASLGASPDLVAVAALSAVSTVTGGRWSVEASWRRGWREQLVLYVAGVAPPGSMKSAAMSAATAPVADLQRELRQRFAVEVADARALREVDEKRLASLQRKAAEAKAGDPENYREQAADLARHLAEQPEPSIPQLFTTDATTEAVEFGLQRNGERFAWLSSEGGLWTTLSGRHASRAGAVSLDIFLQGYTGDAVEVTRLTRDGVSLLSPALTIGMTTQPEHLRAAMKNVEGGEGRGLFDRFLFSWPEAVRVDRSQGTEPVADKVTDAYAAALHRLYREAETIPPGERRVLTMNPDAADTLRSFGRWVFEAGEAGGQLDADGIAGWAEKLPGQVHRLAGVFTLLADPHADAVTLEAAVAAVELGRYFTSHARRTMLELDLGNGVKAARKCWEAIMEARSPRLWRDWPEVVSLQDVSETVKGNRALGLDSAEGVEAALTLLAEGHHLLRRLEPGKGGRKLWAVHPDHRPRR